MWGCCCHYGTYEGREKNERDRMRMKEREKGADGTGHTKGPRLLFILTVEVNNEVPFKIS